MRVALVHDWLTGMRGGERCLEAFLMIYPQADIFTLVHIPGTTSEFIDGRVKQASFLSRIPYIGRIYRLFLPIFPAAVAGLDVRGYDLVISLSHAAAKNVTVHEGATHVCYCFTPMRYVWDQAKHYFGPVLRTGLFPVLEYLRRWDRSGAQKVDHFVAISTFVAARIRLFYGRRAVVISPPVRQLDEVSKEFSESEKATLDALPRQFFLCAGALVPYKRIEVAVEAFNTLGYPLVVVGKGPELGELKRRAAANVFFVDDVTDTLLWECYGRCKALIFPGIEDFGIVPVECMAAGRPIIGVNAGGLRDSMALDRRPGRSPLVAVTSTGVLLSKRAYGSSLGLTQAVQEFLDSEEVFSRQHAQERATHFSYQEFFRSWTRFCEQVGMSGGQSPTSFSGPNKVDRVVGETSC